MSGFYPFLADSILVIHILFVLFVVSSLILTLIGGNRNWNWIRNIWFRTIHLGGIGYVVLQSWFGQICPLTILEMHLRKRAGQQQYDGSFIQHWFEKILYYNAPDWVFVILYTAFGLLVALTWVLFPPKKNKW